MVTDGCANTFIGVVKKAQELVFPSSVWSTDHACILQATLPTGFNSHYKSIPKYLKPEYSGIPRTWKRKGDM